MVKNKFVVEVGDTEQLKQCITRLRNVESVFDAYRVTPGGLSERDSPGRARKDVRHVTLTVAVTGPDRRDREAADGGAGERALRSGPCVGMARRPFDPAGGGLGEGRLPARGHPRSRLAGGSVRRRRRRRPPRLRDLRRPRGDAADQPGGDAATSSKSAIEAGVKRLVYASSVAAYGFHPENPQPLTEDVPARGSESFYYSAQKAELEATCSTSCCRGAGWRPTSSAPASSPGRGRRC